MLLKKYEKRIAKFAKLKKIENLHNFLKYFQVH